LYTSYRWLVTCLFWHIHPCHHQCPYEYHWLLHNGHTESHKAISQRYEQAHTTCESNLWPVFTSLKISYPNGCIFGIILEMWRCPCNTTPFQQLFNDWQFPGLPQWLHCTGVTSDPLQNQTDDNLREVDLDCKVTGEKFSAVLLNYKQCGGTMVCCRRVLFPGCLPRSGRSFWSVWG